MTRFTVLMDIEPNEEPGYSPEDIPLDFECWYGEGWPRETWYNDAGDIDRELGPARTVYHEDDPSIVIKQEWIRNGLRHRDHAPASIWAYTDGTIIKEKYYTNGLLHREGAPAIVERCPATGIVVHEAWYNTGKLHREGKPAEITRIPETGVMDYEVWAIEGKWHRLDGPAYIMRHERTGQTQCQDHYEYGVKIDKDQKLPPPTI